MNTNKRHDLGIAIVGSGKIGALRAQMAANHPAVSFVACADADPGRAREVAEKSGAQFHSANNIDVIAHPDVDAVIVSSSEHAHIEPVLAALRLGKPVLCEKPIGLNLADADTVLDAIAKYNGNVRYGYSRRFKHRYLTVKEQVAQGKLGQITGGHARAYNLRTQGEKAQERSAGISPVVYSLTYYIDLMCWFMENNPVVEVVARGHGLGKPGAVGKVSHDLTWAMLTLADGAVMDVGIYYALPEKYPSRGLSSRLELVGTDGVIVIDGDNTDQVMYSEKGVPHVHLPNQDAKLVFLGSSTPGAWAVGDFWGPLADETRAWLDFLSTGRPCAPATAQDARNNLEISLAIERSAYTRQTVRLPIEK